MWEGDQIPETTLNLHLTGFLFKSTLQSTRQFLYGFLRSTEHHTLLDQVQTEVDPDKDPDRLPHYTHHLPAHLHLARMDHQEDLERLGGSRPTPITVFLPFCTHTHLHSTTHSVEAPKVGRALQSLLLWIRFPLFMYPGLLFAYKFEAEYMART